MANKNTYIVTDNDGTYEMGNTLEEAYEGLSNYSGGLLISDCTFYECKEIAVTQKIIQKTTVEKK